MKRSFIMALLLILSVSSANAVDIVPRVGVDVSMQKYTDFDNKGNAVVKDSGAGVNLGVVFVGDGLFFDIAAESSQLITPVNSKKVLSKGWRSELGLTAGYQMSKHLWLNAGYQAVNYGSSLLGANRGSLQSPFVGFSLSNMQQADYLFSMGVAFTINSKISNFDTTGGTDDGINIAGGIRFVIRKKGSPHMFTWKHRVSGPTIAIGYQDITTKISYSYLFI